MFHSNSFTIYNRSSSCSEVQLFFLISFTKFGRKHDTRSLHTHSSVAFLFKLQTTPSDIKSINQTHDLILSLHIFFLDYNLTRLLFKSASLESTLQLYASTKTKLPYRSKTHPPTTRIQSYAFTLTLRYEIQLYAFSIYTQLQLTTKFNSDYSIRHCFWLILATLLFATKFKSG